MNFDAWDVFGIFACLSLLCACAIGYAIEQMSSDIEKRRRRRRWPRQGYTQHRSYCSDCKRQYPDEY